MTKYEMLKSMLLQRMAKTIGMRLMDKWNEDRHISAVMGHLEGDDYKFIINSDNSEWEVTVHNLSNQITGVYGGPERKA